jgi:hypothetical protein
MRVTPFSRRSAFLRRGFGGLVDEDSRSHHATIECSTPVRQRRHELSLPTERDNGGVKFGRFIQGNRAINDPNMRRSVGENGSL